jgi:hypothetical protein
MDAVIEQDAREFGLHVQQGGWRLGLLVARNVEKGKTGGVGGGAISTENALKVTATDFAGEASTSAARVLRFLKAWDKAAAAGHVPYAANLSPGSEVELNAEKLPGWEDFYTATDGKKNTASTKLVVEGIETATPEKLDKIVAQLPTKTKAKLAQKVLADEDAADEAMSDAKTRHAARAADERVTNANKGQFDSEHKAKSSQKTQDEIDNESITRLFARSGKIIDAWRNFGRLWADLYPRLSDSAQEDAVSLLNQVAMEASEIESALRGEDMDTVISAILKTERSTEGR